MKNYEQIRLKLNYLSRLNQATIDKAILDLNISGSQSLILDVIDTEKQCSQKDIANYLNISTPAITKAIKSLLDKDLITKQVSNGDLRTNTIKLTDRGLEALKSINKRIDSIDHLMFKGLDNLELDSLEKSMDLIIDNLKTNKKQLDYKKEEFNNLYIDYDKDSYYENK